VPVTARVAPSPDDDGTAGAGGGDPGTSTGDISPADDAGGGSTSDSAGDGSTAGSPAPAPILPALTARANLTLPLATLLGLADRPGAGHGLGPLDPAQVRDLAAATANSPHSHWCATLTDTHGTPIAHGRAPPARINKTGPASRDGPPGWAFTPRADDPGPPGGYGPWTLMGL
jgi:hypothetical protein